MNESRTHKSFSIHSRSSSFHHLIIVSKRVLLQLIASTIIRAIFLLISALILVILTSESKRRRDVLIVIHRTRHFRTIEFVSSFIPFAHFLFIIFFFFLFFFSHHTHRLSQFIDNWLSSRSQSFLWHFKNFLSLFMKKSVVEEHLQLCFQLRDFFRTKHKFSDLVFTDTKSFISNIISHTIFSLISKAVKTRSEKCAKKSIWSQN